MDIQTDAYLEELMDTVPEAEVMTQTDAFMDRPPTPLFVPMKIGVDVETQIEAGSCSTLTLKSNRYSRCSSVRRSSKVSWR